MEKDKLMNKRGFWFKTAFSFDQIWRCNYGYKNKVKIEYIYGIANERRTAREHRFPTQSTEDEVTEINNEYNS